MVEYAQSSLILEEKMEHRVRVTGSIVRFLVVILILFLGGWQAQGITQDYFFIAMIISFLILIAAMVIEIAVLAICGDLGLIQFLIYFIYDCLETFAMIVIVLDLVEFVVCFLGYQFQLTWSFVLGNLFVAVFIYFSFTIKSALRSSPS